MAEMGEDKAIQSSWEGDRKIIQTEVVFRSTCTGNSENGKPKASQDGFLNYLLMFRKKWNYQLKKPA